MKFLILFLLSMPVLAQSNFKKDNVSFIVLTKYERIPNNIQVIQKRYFAFNPDIKRVYVPEQIWNQYNEKQKVYFIKRVVHMMNKPINLKPISIPEEKRYLMI